MALATRLTEFFAIRFPILNAAMGGTAGGRLAAAVTEAGGLGLIGGGASSREYLEREFRVAGNQPVGCGFITWQLAANPELLDVALAHAPAAVLLSFGDPGPYIPKIKAAGLPLICQVQTLAMAREVLQSGADVVVAQGTEAGGHGGSRGTLPLVPAVADAAAAINPAAIVVAAGGITDGRGLAAALMLGAEGVLIGTRFHATQESLLSEEAKARIVAADGDQTVRGRTFDIARGQPWPEQFTLRSIANDFTRLWHGRDEALSLDTAARERCLKAYAAEDYRIRAVLAGEGIDQITAVEPAAAIVAHIASEAEAALARRFS